MGDKRRFARFAELIAQEVPDRQSRLADVACGKGYLQMALRQLGYTNVVSFDKRKGLAKPHRQAFYRHEWFSFNKHRKEFAAVVALHPDQGTDHSILYAVNNTVPFLVCPCCLLPSASAFHPPRHSFAAWVQHLTGLASPTHQVREHYLNLQGRNLVLVGHPRE